MYFPTRYTPKLGTLVVPHTLITFLQICKSCNSIFNKPDRTSEISVPLLSFTCSLGMCLENFFKTETLEDHYR